MEPGARRLLGGVVGRDGVGGESHGAVAVGLLDLEVVEFVNVNNPAQKQPGAAARAL